MLAKECVGILSLPTKCKDPAEYKRVIHSERNVRHHCVIFVYLESDLSRLDACVRSVCLVRIDDAVFWSRRHLSLSLFSLSVYPAENLSRVSSHSVLFRCYRNNHCAGLGMCFFKKWLPTRNLSLRYIILPWFYSYLLTLPWSNPVVWKRGSDLTSRTRCLSYQYEDRVRE